MRYGLLIVLASILLAVAACGGGDEDAASTDIFDTEVLGGTETDIAPPPAETAAEPAAEPPVQVSVPKGQPIGPQSSAEKVAELQTVLIALGFKIGEPDGVYGAKTRSAVVRFQKNHNLDADGLVGARTARAMNEELAKRAPG
jgi:peptidoglycan hydrolase-like protein with peptidoglycan-binding domain